MAGILCAGSLGLYMVRVAPSAIALIGLAIIWISVLPGLIYLASKEREPVPFFAVSGLFYSITFGLPVFTIPLMWKDASSILIYSRVTLSDIRVDVLIIVALGIAAFVATFFISRRYLFVKLPRFRFPKSIDQSNIGPLFWLLLISHQIFEFSPNLFNAVSAGQFLDPAGYIAFGGLYLMWRRGMLSRIESSLLLCAFLSIEVYLRLRFLFLTDLLFFLIFFTFLLWRERHYKLLGLCSILAIVVLSTYSVSTVVRSSPDSKLLVMGKAYIQLMVHNRMEVRKDEIVDSGFSLDSTFRFEGKIGSLVRRMSHIWVFHAVADKSPSELPYWRGRSYLPIITSFIPRVIYPDKPEERVGYKFGVEYGFIEPVDTHMSINLPWITEMLVNFGKLGVVLGMMLAGAFLDILDRLFNSRNATDLECVIGLTLIFPMVYPESNFTVMTGSMLPLFVSLFVYFTGGAWILKRVGWRQRSQHPEA